MISTGFQLVSPRLPHLNFMKVRLESRQAKLVCHPFLFSVSLPLPPAPTILPSHPEAFTRPSNASSTLPTHSTSASPHSSPLSHVPPRHPPPENRPRHLRRSRRDGVHLLCLAALPRLLPFDRPEQAQVRPSIALMVAPIAQADD